MNGLFCTRFGAERLLNEIKNFQFGNKTPSLTAYAYGEFFDIHITVKLNVTSCLGITNICAIVNGKTYNIEILLSI